jgi:hypothetical protein
VKREKIKRQPGRRWVEGEDFRLADEVHYIQSQAADHVGCFVSIGQLLFFSTETGDAWLLDPSDQLAVRLARGGDPEPIYIEETDSNFSIGWKGNYRIDGRCIHLYRSRVTSHHYHPGLPYCPDCPTGLELENFQGRQDVGISLRSAKEEEE